MRQLLMIVAAAMVFAEPAFAQKGGASEPDEIVEFSAQDAEMNAAIEAARATLPQFFADFDAAPAAQRDRYAVKVGMPVEGGGQEHIWVDDLRREGGQLVGALANEPHWLPGMHRGSRVVVDPARISDWSIHALEGLYGSYTTRVMLPYLDPQSAAQTRQALTPTPTPSHWST